MKKLFFILLVLGFALPVMAQKGEAKFFQTLSTQRSIDPVIKKASLGISRNFGSRVLLDSLVYFTNSFEQAVLSGKSSGLVKPETIKNAMKKYPGSDLTAINQRLKLYATEPR